MRDGALVCFSSDSCRLDTHPRSCSAEARPSSALFSCGRKQRNVSEMAILNVAIREQMSTMVG